MTFLIVDANTKDVTCIVIDKPAMVQMLQPGLSATFTDYAQTVVMPYNMRQQSIKLYTRIDIVYDVYYEISIKNATREKRGRGFRCTL